MLISLRFTVSSMYFEGHVQSADIPCWALGDPLRTKHMPSMWLGTLRATQNLQSYGFVHRHFSKQEIFIPRQNWEYKYEMNRRISLACPEKDSECKTHLRAWQWILTLNWSCLYYIQGIPYHVHIYAVVNCHWQN